MPNQPSPRRQPLRYDVRVAYMLPSGNVVNSSKTRSGKLDVAILAVMEICRLWAVANGRTYEGTTVSLVDLEDGTVVMLLRWNGFNTENLERALQALTANGFELEEVAHNGQ